MSSLSMFCHLNALSMHMHVIFTDKLVIFRFFTHYGNYNENHLLFHYYLLDWCSSAISFLLGLVQISPSHFLLIIHLSYQEPTSGSYYINQCTIIWACKSVWNTLIFKVNFVSAVGDPVMGTLHVTPIGCQ